MGTEQEHQGPFSCVECSNHMDTMSSCEHSPMWYLEDRGDVIPITGKFAVYLAMDHHLKSIADQKAGRPAQWQPDLNHRYRDAIYGEFMKPKGQRASLEMRLTDDTSPAPEFPTRQRKGVARDSQPPQVPPSPAQDDGDADDRRPPSPGPVSAVKAGKRKALPEMHTMAGPSSSTAKVPTAAGMSLEQCTCCDY